MQANAFENLDRIVRLSLSTTVAVCSSINSRSLHLKDKCPFWLTTPSRYSHDLFPWYQYPIFSIVLGKPLAQWDTRGSVALPHREPSSASAIGNSVPDTVSPWLDYVALGYRSTDIGYEDPILTVLPCDIHILSIPLWQWESWDVWWSNHCRIGSYQAGHSSEPESVVPSFALLSNSSVGEAGKDCSRRSGSLRILAREHWSANCQRCGKEVIRRMEQRLLCLGGQPIIWCTAGQLASNRSSFIVFFFVSLRTLSCCRKNK